MGQTVPVFLINLDRRPDRLAQMKSEFAKVGATFERIPAVDATEPSEGLEKWRADPRVSIGQATLCCMLSHLSAFRRIVADDIPLAMVAEDDVELSPDVLPLLSSGDWLPAGIGLVQCETTVGRRKHKRLLGPHTTATPASGRVLRRLHARAMGAACYLITKDAAQKLIAGTKLALPADHLLFNSAVSPVFHKVGVAVLTPAIARQTYGLDQSDNRVPAAVGSKRPTGSATSGVCDNQNAAKSQLPRDQHCAKGRRLNSPTLDHLKNRKTLYGRMLMHLTYLTTTMPTRLWAIACGARYMKYEFRK